MLMRCRGSENGAAKARAVRAGLCKDTGARPVGQINIFLRGILMYTDKTLKCKDCGADFVFTAGEQEFYAEKGFENEPQRCKACRDAKKNASRGQRQFFEATCAVCGGVARVPFEPKGDRPVLCSECFAKQKGE